MDSQRKRANHAVAVALHFAHYNLIPVHTTLQMSRAMAHGISDHIWTVGQLLERISNWDTTQKRQPLTSGP
jgi:hypothetical protein